MQVLTDDHLSTRFAWARPHTLSSESTAAISWEVPPGVQPGGRAPPLTLLPERVSAWLSCDAVNTACFQGSWLALCVFLCIHHVVSLSSSRNRGERA
jgi:hypothetical protein